MFDKDKIFAYLNLDDNELFSTSGSTSSSSAMCAADLVVYLQRRPTCCSPRPQRRMDRKRSLSAR